jgi:hypothetical protein
MTDAFHLGGWGMYPTTLFGIVLVISAARFAIGPEARRLATVRGLAFLTFLSGCLGFIAGTIKTFTSLGGLDTKDAPTVALIGVGESLNNVGLSLAMLGIVWIAVTIGSARGRGTAAELTDPLM